MEANVKKPHPAGTVFGTMGRGLARAGSAVYRFFRKLLGVRSTRSLAGDICNILFLTILAIFMAIPLVYVVCNAFKPIDELYLSPPRFFVQNPTLDNLKDLMTVMNNSWVPITRYFFNTLFITVAGTGLHVIFASMAAYVLEKHRFYGRNAFFGLVVMTLMFSPTVTSIPNFVIMSGIGFVDTYLALIIPAIGSSLGLFLMKQAWLTLIIFSSQTLWNSTGGVLIRSEELKPLPYALNQIMAGGFARAGAASAVGLILMSVPILIFIFSQSQILDTMSTSGIKE